MESDWLSFEEVQALLLGDEKLLLKYVDESPLRAINADHDSLVVVRDHAAWYVDGQGWCDTNEPATAGRTSRQMINFYDKSSWSKLPVPVSTRIKSVNWDGDVFSFSTSQGKLRCTPRQVWLAIHDSITGHKLSEETIDHNFRKLDGSAPLEWVNPVSACPTSASGRQNTVEHPPIDDAELGRITWDDSAGSWRFKANIGDDSPIEVTFLPNDDPIEKTMQLVHRSMKWLHANENRVRTYIADKMLKLANDWRQEDEKPISAKKFISRMRLDSVSFYEDGTAHLCYNDDDIFGGHAIFVRVTRDGKLTGEPELFG